MKKALFQCALVALVTTVAACGSQLVEFPVDDGTGGAATQSSSTCPNVGGSTSDGGSDAGAGPQSSSHSSSSSASSVSSSSTGAGAGGSGGNETSGSGAGGSGGQGAGGEGGSGSTGGAGGTGGSGAGSCDDHCQVEHDCCVEACEQTECNSCPWGSYSCQDSCTTCKQQCDCRLDQCELGDD